MKTVPPGKPSREMELLLNQKSTQRAIQTVKYFRQEKVPRKARFYDRTCAACGAEFHPRHPSAKYCSFECQVVFNRNRKGK